MKRKIWALVISFLLLATGAGYAVTTTDVSEVPVDPAVSETQSSGTDSAATAPDTTVDPQAGVTTDAASNPDKIKGKTPDSLAAAAPAAAAVAATTGVTPAKNLSNFSLKPVQISPAGNSGVAVTSIPVEVPPGRSGIQPNISLNYSSSAGNGWLGVGWNIDMGAIQRNTKSLNYSANDYVAIVNGSSSELTVRADWGSDYFGAEIEGAFSKYYFVRADNRWEVTTKDGTKYYYGKDPFTLHEARQVNGNGTFKWCLARVQDTNGNFMTVDYIISNGDIYPDRIDYTGNISGLGTTNYIKFYTEGRSDVPSMYNTNSSVKTVYRLKTIEVVANGTRARSYKLTYVTGGNTKRSLLATIQQYGSDAVIDGYGTVTGGSTLPALTLSYAGGSPQFNANAYGPGWSDAGGWADPAYNSTIQFPDINGDGKADVCARLSDGIRCYLSTGSGFSTYVDGPNWSNSGGWADPANYSTIQFPDINGDGRADVCARASDGIRCHLSTGSGFSSLIDGPNWTNTGGWAVPERYLTIQYPDINGDGKADVCGRNANGIICYKSTGNGFSSSVDGPNWTDANGWLDSAVYTTIRYPDINGDGKADVCARASDGIRCHLSTGSGFSSLIDGPNWTNTGGWADPAYYSTIQFADINGDGKADVCARNSGGIRCHLSTGSGFSSGIDGPGWSNSGGWADPAYYSTIRFADINGDGRSDVCARASDGIRCYLSTGDGFSTRVNGPSWTDSNGWYEHEHYSTIRYADMNGNGKSDVCARSNTKITCEKTADDGTESLRVISNGIGAVTTLEYKPSSSYDNCFLINGRDTCLPFVVQTLSKTTINDGNGGSSESNYTYDSGYFDAAEREFRGFGKTKATAPDLTTAETWFHQDAFRKGMQYKTEMNEPSGVNPLLSRTTLTWENPTGNPAWAFIKLNQKITEIVENVVTTSYTQEDYTYDSTNGNLLSTVTSGTDAEIITAATLYQNYGTWVWRPIQTTVTGSESGKVRETNFGYESITGNMLYKELWLDPGTKPKIVMDYDTYGNQTTLQDANDPAKITATEYDTATYTYPVKVTYPQTGTVTHIVESDYDYKYGSPNWTKDENGNFTYYTYDVFGRIQQVDSPDGGQMTTEYHVDAFPIYTVTKVKENASGQTIDKYEYADGLGRGIQTITFGEAGKSIVTKTHYNNMGRADLSEGPFFSTGTGYPKQPPFAYPWVQTVYDYRGRPTTVTSPDIEYSTVTATYSYSGLSATITDPDGKKKTTRKDYLGRIIEVKEYGDNNAIYTTTYTYNAAGDLKTVTDHNGVVTTINYDTLGRKINMTDPDMGYWQYTYDDSGNLKTQTDAKGQTITFNYDALNRITTKTYSTSDPTVTYTYDKLSIPNGRGRLYSVTNTNVTTTTNSYDAMGRVMSATKTVTGDPVQYTTLNEYDLSGKTVKTTYPDNFYVTNSYYPGTGLLEKVTGSNGVVYARNTLYEPSGKIGQINHQNGTATRYSYDSWSTKLTAIVTTSPSSDGNPRNDVINRGYSYSRAGDINTITDYQKGAELGLANNIFNYQYTYDNLHRLLGEATTNNTYSPSAFVYDAIGNITTKVTGANILSYAYDPSHKHAVKTITFNSVPYTYDYDDNGNMFNGPDFTDLSNIATRQITYNADNMPVQVTHSRYGVTNIVYDGEGGRAKKVSPSGTTWYIGEHFEIINGVSTKYIFAGNLRLAKVTSLGTNYFHKDHLGSSSAMTNESGGIVETTSYTPYGEQRDHTGAVVTNYKFTDQELDPETGLYYYGARYYDPAIGRFISADTIVPSFSDPQSLNRYSYARNNPIIYTDPSGHLFGIDDLTIAVLAASMAKGAAIGAAVGGTISAATGGNVLQGMATGAISGAFFGGVGAIGQAGGITGAAAAGLHAGAGAISGGINAAISGGNIGMGMLTGGVSGGISEYAGGQMFGDGGLFADALTPGSAGEFAAQLAGTSFIGGITGGITEAMYGGSFGHGFGMGAMTASIGYLANNAMHKELLTVEGEASTYYLPGNETSIGEPYDATAMTGAARREHITNAMMRKGVYAKVMTVNNEITVRVNDHFGKSAPSNRVIDLTPKGMSTLKGGIPYVESAAGARALGIANVTVTFYQRW